MNAQSLPSATLDALREITLPEPVSYAPQTIGWWLVFGVLAVMASAAQPASWWSSASGDRVEVLGSTVNIRESHTTQSPVLTTATQGDKLKVIERRNDWCRVQTPDGREGWIYSSLVQ